MNYLNQHGTDPFIDVQARKPLAVLGRQGTPEEEKIRWLLKLANALLIWPVLCMHISITDIHVVIQQVIQRYPGISIVIHKLYSCKVISGLGYT